MLKKQRSLWEKMRASQRFERSCSIPSLVFWTGVQQAPWKRDTAMATIGWKIDRPGGYRYGAEVVPRHLAQPCAVSLLFVIKRLARSVCVWRGPLTGRKARGNG